MTQEQTTGQPMAEPPKDNTVPSEASSESIKTDSSDTSKLNWRQRFKTWYGEHKKWSIPLTLLLVVLILAAIPFSRYSFAGLVLKKDFTIKVVDTATSTPVSGATVSVGSLSSQTDASGMARLHNLKVGHHSILFDKKYYKNQQTSFLVPILSQKDVPTVKLTATGRQVKIQVVNSINQNPLSDVNIDTAGISAKTDKNGEAWVVLPAGIPEQTGKLSLNGYNLATVTIKVSNDKIQQNKFSLTPAGEVYFLSKLSGKIDVVKTNLDGTNRKTVLAGTGKEDDQGTVLLASRDWKYLALLSSRASDLAALYLIDTSNDNLTTIDSGNAKYTPVGWVNDSFVYSLSRNDIQPWQTHAQALKSYNAPSKQLLTLDQTKAQGASQSDYAKESYGPVYEIGKNVIYEKEWSSDYYNPDVLNDKKAGIYSIDVNGSSPQTLKTFSYITGQSTFINSIPYEVKEIYYSVTEKGTQTYYSYTNGKVSARAGIADKFNKYYQGAITYLQSPSGNQTFWAESRDGKNTLLIGDQDGENGKSIATLSDYFTYGWYTDEYLLVSKNSSELYVMPKAGSKTPIKVSDYHKPAQTFNGYGGGYGGL